MRYRSFATLAVLVVLAGCSSGGGDSPGASPSASEATQVLELSRRLAQCARDHGYPNVPDPVIDGNDVVWPADGGRELKDQLQAVTEQVPECKAISDQIASLNGRRDPETPSAADMPKLQAFAKCMREHGIDGFPDPKPDGTFPLIGTPLENEGKSERVLAALDACKGIYDKRIVLS